VLRLNNPLVKVPLRYGIAGFFLLLLLFLVFYFTEDNPLLAMPPVDFFLLPLFVFFAIKDFRDNHNGRTLFFWEGMTVGFFTYISMAVLYGVFVLLFLYAVDCNLLTDFITNKVLIMEEGKERVIQEMGQATYDATLLEVRNTTAFIVSLDSFLKKCILGLLFTIMLSMILRNSTKN